MAKKQRKFDWLVWLWFIFLAILFTRPLITRMGNEIAGEIGDNIYFIWMIGWVKKALFKLHVDPMNVWFLNYPEGWNMAHTEITPAQLALGQVFAFLGSETFAYNAVMLLSFALSGIITYHWVKHLTGSAAAGLLSGTIFACLPYRQAHFLAGHLNLSGTQWLPLFFWGWFDLIRDQDSGFRDQKIRTKPALMAALGLGLTALTSQYYFFMMVIVAGFQMVWVILVHQRSALKSAAFWKSFGLFILFSLPLFEATSTVYTKKSANTFAGDEKYLSVKAEVEAAIKDYQEFGDVTLNEAVTLRDKSDGTQSSMITFTASTKGHFSGWKLIASGLPAGKLLLVLLVFACLSAALAFVPSRFVQGLAVGLAIVALLIPPVFSMNITRFFAREIGTVLSGARQADISAQLALADGLLYGGRAGERIQSLLPGMDFTCTLWLWLLLPAAFLLLCGVLRLQNAQLSSALGRGALYAFVIALSLLILYP